MKIIDLLNKIANSEGLPLKIKFNDLIFRYNETFDDYEEVRGSEYLLNEHNDNLNEFLNDEVEIIEEDKKIELEEMLEELKFYREHPWNEKEEDNKIEKLDIELSPDDGDKVNGYLVCEVTRDLAFKINEIIEVLNGKD